MKKIIGIILALIMVTGIMPVVSMAADTDPEGTVIMYNSTSSAQQTGFTCWKDIGAAGTNNPVIDSKMTTAGANGTTPIAISEYYGDGWVKWTPAKGALKSDVAYEVYFWNIAEIDDNEKYRDKEYKPNLCRNIYYEIGGRQMGSDSQRVSTRYYFDAATCSNGENGWVKIGDSFIFNGDGLEYVQAGKFGAYGDYGYFSAVKFVPVTVAASNTDVESIYFGSYNGSWTGTQLTPAYSADVNVNNYVLNVPASADFTNGSRLYIVAKNPEAGISTNPANPFQKKGTANFNYGLNIADLAGKGTDLSFIVTSKDPSVTKTYNVHINVYDDTKAVVSNAEGANASVKMNGTTATTVAPYSWSPMPMGDASTTKYVALDKFGDSLEFKPTISTAGYYDVYTWGTGDYNKFNALELSVAVTHNGLREEKVIPHGCFVGQGQWVYVGTYYFNAQGDESITYTKATENTDFLAVTNIKLVPSAGNSLEKTLGGISVCADGKTQSVTQECANGYVFPLSKGEYETASLTVNTTNSSAQTITVNGAEAVANTPLNIAVEDGENTVKIVITNTNGSKEEYEVILHKQTNAFNYAPLLPNLNTTNIPYGVNYMKDDVSYHTRATDGNMNYVGWKVRESYTGYDDLTSGSYRVMVWRPSFGEVVNAVDYGRTNTTIDIQTGLKTVSKTVDWKSGPSGWIDLGVYYFDMSPAAVDGAYIMLNIPEDGKVLVDRNYGFAFLPVERSSGMDYIKFDGVEVEAANVGKTDVSADNDINIEVETNIPTDTITVNGEAITASTPYTMTLTKTFTDFEVVVTSADASEINTYKFTVFSPNFLENGVEYKKPQIIVNGNSLQAKTAYFAKTQPDENATLVLAQYKKDAEGKMELLGVSNLASIAHVLSQKTDAETAAVDKIPGVTDIKVFLWKSLSSMVPVFEATVGSAQ